LSLPGSSGGLRAKPHIFGIDAGILGDDPCPRQPSGSPIALPMYGLCVNSSVSRRDARKLRHVGCNFPSMQVSEFRANGATALPLPQAGPPRSKGAGEQNQADHLTAAF
jgi:ribosomal protein S16